MMNKKQTHPFTESHNYRATVRRDDGREFEVIAAIVEMKDDGSGVIHGIQPSNYRGDFPNGLFWASGSLGGPLGEERRGLYPSVTIDSDDPLEIRDVVETDEPLRSER